MDKAWIGHYKILGQLGVGGMGEVYLAEDATLGRKVALKVLPERMAADPDRLQRFETEARVVAALNHPGIVTLYSLEEDAGVRFLTMERVDGKTLQQVIHQGRSSPEAAAALAVEIADALGAAHAGGITHRDLKPANIMQTKEGRVKILDFGLARLHERMPQTSGEGATAETASDNTMTQKGTVLGTVAYMSPEQALGHPVDPRSDIFSLGIVLYKLATGQHPFPASSHAERLAAILRDTPTSVSRAAPEVPSPLARCIDRCLCKDPDHRFQSASELGDALKGAPVTLDSGRAGGAPSVAVLPFSDLSENRDQDHFCAGLAEELIDALTALEGLRVASPTSTVRFKRQPEDVRTIGELLQVGSLLEGSLRTAGERLRVTVQFTSTKDGYLLWSGTFDRSMGDIFTVQSDIAHRVVAALKPELTAGTSTGLG